MYAEKYFTSQDGLKLYYRDYNDTQKDATPLLCLHGLTRNSADFHKPSLELSTDRRVIVPDMRGRGKSAYDPDYKNYKVPTYVGDVLSLLISLNLHEVIVIGTSMGGLMAMGLAVAQPTLLKGIVLNDIGPEIDIAGINRIATYVGEPSDITSWDQAALAVKGMNVHAFPDYTDEDWLYFAKCCFSQQDNANITANYDDNIGLAIKESAQSAVPVDIWTLFEAMKEIPTLTIRGETSDILSAETLTKMMRVHNCMDQLILPGRGHAPDLMEPESLRAMREFILKAE